MQKKYAAILENSKLQLLQQVVRQQMACKNNDASMCTWTQTVREVNHFLALFQQQIVS